MFDLHKNVVKMKEETTLKMSEKEDEILKILCRLGFAQPEGKVLIYLLNFGEGKSRDIERTMEMSQPEVSIAIKKIQDFLEIKKSHKKARGRPVFSYKLKKPMSKIVDEAIKIKTDNIQKNIEELKKITKELEN